MMVGPTSFYLERAHTMEQIAERLQEIAKELASDGEAIVSVSHAVGHAHPRGSYEFIVVGRPTVPGKPGPVAASADTGAPTGRVDSER
jgi:phosphopantetheine adenylyltransferase